MITIVTLWRTPSGRLHQQRSCSGGATPKNTTRVTMNLTEVAALPHEAICRCAWRTRERAVEQSGGK